jgi:hypothetical protein
VWDSPETFGNRLEAADLDGDGVDELLIGGPGSSAITILWGGTVPGF